MEVCREVFPTARGLRLLMCFLFHACMSTAGNRTEATSNEEGRRDCLKKLEWGEGGGEGGGRGEERVGGGRRGLVSLNSAYFSSRT